MERGGRVDEQLVQRDRARDRRRQKHDKCWASLCVTALCVSAERVRGYVIESCHLLQVGSADVRQRQVAYSPSYTLYCECMLLRALSATTRSSVHTVTRPQSRLVSIQAAARCPTPRSVITPITLARHSTSDRTANMSSQAQKDITSWASKDGQFRRQTSSFRDSISKDGQFTPDEGRYHLYVSLACPWAYVVPSCHLAMLPDRGTRAQEWLTCYSRLHLVNFARTPPRQSPHLDCAVAQGLGQVCLGDGSPFVHGRLGLVLLPSRPRRGRRIPADQGQFASPLSP